MSKKSGIFLAVQQHLISGYVVSIPAKSGRNGRKARLTRHYYAHKAVDTAIKTGGIVLDIRTGKKFFPVEL